MTQLQPSRCQAAEFQRSIFCITPEVATPIEALLEPKYWAHVSMQFRPGTHLEIYPPEGNYFAELLVQDCGKLYAKVALLRKVDFEAVEVGKQDLDLSGFSVGYGGQALQWCVYRLLGKGKKDLLKSELGHRDAADAWLKQHARTVARPAA